MADSLVVVWPDPPGRPPLNPDLFPKAEVLQAGDGNLCLGLLRLAHPQ